MQIKDFFNQASGGLLEAAQTVFFRMLPRSAQIQKVQGEINRSLLKQYGRLSRLEIDRENRTIRADLDLKGEKECVQIRISNYRLVQEVGKNPLFAPGTIEVSREWLDALLKTLVKANVIPSQVEVKNLLHQTVAKSIL